MRNPTMIGQRVYLRPIEESDAELMSAYDAAETETFFDDGRMPTSPIYLAQEYAEAFDTAPPATISLAICLHADDRCIGVVELEDIDWINRTAETGSWIGTVTYRGQGYGPEAKHLLLEYAFDRLQLQVLFSTVWEPNTRSAAAVRRQGYREAGRLKTLATKGRRPRDWIFFSLTRDEWLAARAAYQTRRAEAAQS